MCGVHAVVRMPSAAAMRAISSDIASSVAPSSMPGSRWQWRSITAGPDRSATPGMQHHAGQRCEPHRVGRHVQREIEQAVQDQRQQPDAGGDLQHGEAARAFAPQQLAHPHHVGDEQQRHDHRRHQAHLQEELQVVVVRVVDVAAEDPALEAREHVGEGRQPAAEGQELDRGAQRRGVDGEPAFARQPQLVGLEALEDRREPDQRRQRDADDHEPADDQVARAAGRRGRAPAGSTRTRGRSARSRCRRATA